MLEPRRSAARYPAKPSEGRTMKRFALVLALTMLAGCATAIGGNPMPAETRSSRPGPPSTADEMGKGGGGY